MHQFFPEEGTFKRYLHNPDVPTTLNHNRIVNIIEDENGRLWVSTRGGLNAMNDDGTFERFLSDDVTKKISII